MIRISKSSNTAWAHHTLSKNLHQSFPVTILGFDMVTLSLRNFFLEFRIPNSPQNLISYSSLRYTHITAFPTSPSLSLCSQAAELPLSYRRATLTWKFLISCTFVSDFSSSTAHTFFPLPCHSKYSCRIPSTPLLTRFSKWETLPLICP